MAEFLPVGNPGIETARRRTLKVGARLERGLLKTKPPAIPEAKSIAVSVDGGHVKSIRSYQVRSFEILLADASNDRGQRQLFSSVAVEADRERLQLEARPAQSRSYPGDADDVADRRSRRAAVFGRGSQSRSDASRVGLVSFGNAGSARGANRPRLAVRDR